MLVHTVDAKTIQREIMRRARAAKAAELRPQFKPAEFFFGKQKEFFDVTARNRAKVACCSRRAGKTIGMVGDIIGLCTTEKNVRVLYITLTRENCLEIIWPDLMAYIEKFEIPVKINQVRLSVTFLDTGAVFSCAGAKDEREIGKFRGRKLRRIYIDEAQNFPGYIAKMIKEDLMPTLRDLRGDLVVTGTPGPLKRGFFYDIIHNGTWDSRTWTAFDNPHMHDPANGKDLQKTLDEELALNGGDKNDPAYIRETYGVWVEDKNALVFKFNDAVNVGVPGAGAKLTYIFGVDLGYKDADAVAVLGYNHTDGRVYLVEEIITRKQGITPLMTQIDGLKLKYDPVKIVMDAGGLGTKIQAEMQPRYGTLLAAAEKARKFEFIELLNDDLRQGKLKALKGSHFEEDCYQVQWDRTGDDPTRLKISNSFHSDICDAVLYAWRECKHYYVETEASIPKPADSTFGDHLEALEMEAWEAKQAGHDQDWGVDQGSLDSLFED